MEKQEIGKITHYFDKIGVAVLELSADLKLGEKISIEGHDNIVEMTVDSMQIDRNPIEEAKAGQAIGLKTPDPVKPGDVVYKVSE
ncbi:translation elongation factor-like protein [Candidatus Woesearchaeota archaeon]|nr:translation elongation factor-like protein [Candidatus Woesearchaeota archaeon]MBW3022402.1 translation elongation factor-like protein [Candidatus Woesearchaeota archaeon]